MSLGEIFSIGAERLARQVYWSAPRLAGGLRSRFMQLRSNPLRVVRRQAIAESLAQIGVCKAPVVMAHTQTDGICLKVCADGEKETGLTGISAATVLLDLLIQLVGDRHTLVMPTNPRYQDKPGLTSGIPRFSPKRTQCSVGLINELFWRSPNVERSLFPFNTLAARGPLATDLLRDNLNRHKPTAHGAYSGYYRMCLNNALVISIGIPLRNCITIAHVVEEIRPDWPIADFFEERTFEVEAVGGWSTYCVRLRRAKYAELCYCRRKMGRDLVAEGVVHESTVDGVRIDWAWAREVYEFFMRKTENGPYPYYGRWMV